MAEPVRHRQTKGAETDMLSLPPLRHISTLPWSCENGTAGYQAVVVMAFGDFDANRRHWHLRATVGHLGSAVGR
jgi:hypothetical protein